MMRDGSRRLFAPKIASLSIVFAVAIMVRLVAMATMGFRIAPDTNGYMAAAAAFLVSPLTSAEEFIRLPPLYSLVLAVTGVGLPAAAVNLILGAAIAPLLGLATARHFGLRVGITAGLLAAFEVAFVQWSLYLVTDTLALFLFALLIERSSAILAGTGRGTTVVAGLVAGLLVLTRAAYAAPALVLAFANLHIGRGRLLLYFVAMLGIIGIATFRNVAVGVGPTPYRDQGWFLLWAGTTWKEVGRGTVGVDIIFPPGHDSWTSEERQEFYRSATLEQLRERPLDFVGQVARKSLWFWMPAYPEWSLLHKLWSSAVYGLLYVFAIVGAVRTRGSPFTQLLLVSVLAAHAVVAITIVDYDGRYRLPAELCLLPLAASGLLVLRPLVARAAKIRRTLNPA